MSALLNASAEVTRAMPPLVAAPGRGWYAWVQDGRGFTLDTRGAAQWQPMTDAPGLGGHVLTASQVVALVAAHGRPT